MDLLERPGLPQVFYHSVLKHPKYKLEDPRFDKLEDPRFDKLEDPRFEYHSENSKFFIAPSMLLLFTQYIIFHVNYQA